MIRYEPGVSYGETAGSRFGSSSFNIRGIDGDRVKILVDGVSQAADYSFGPYLKAQRNYVDIESLKAVEIIKSPGSALYGSDAIGGVVAYTTKDPSDLLVNGKDAYTSIKSQYSSANNGFTNTLTAAGSNGSLEGMVIYTRRNMHERETHGGSNINGDARGQANPEDTTGNNLLAKTFLNLDDHRLGLTIEVMDSNTESNQKSEIKTVTGRFASYDQTAFTTDDTRERQRVTFSHDWDADTALFDSMKWALSWQNTETIEITRNQRSYTAPVVREESNTRKSRYEEEGFQFSAQADKEFVTGDAVDHHFIYGLDIHESELSNRRQVNNTTDVRDFPQSKSLQAGVFIQDEITFGDSGFTLIPGARYDSFKLTPEADALYLASNPANTSPKSSKDSKLSMKLGATWEISNETTLFSQIAEGFKAPTAEQMFGEFQNFAHRYQRIANPDLKPETSTSVELGVRGKFQKAHYEVVGFSSRYDQFIEDTAVANPTNNGIPFTQQANNLDGVKIYGLEAKSEVELGLLTSSFENFSLFSSAAWAKGKYDNPKTGTEPLNSIAPLKGVFSLKYAAPVNNWGSAATLTLVSAKERKDIDSTEAEAARISTQAATSGYGLVDLTAWYKPADSLTLRAGLFNITDKKYHHWADVNAIESNDVKLDRYTQPGRNFSVSAKWEI